MMRAKPVHPEQQQRRKLGMRKNLSRAPQPRLLPRPIEQTQDVSPLIYRARDFR